MYFCIVLKKCYLCKCTLIVQPFLLNVIEEWNCLLNYYSINHRIIELWFEMGSALYYDLMCNWSLLPPFHSRVLMKSPAPVLHQPQKYKDRGILHPKRSTEDRSDQSSVKSTDSSNYPSPCASPSPPSSAKVEYQGFVAHLMLHI